MKNSTILVFGTLALAGAGAYFYLKGKKSSTVSNAVDDSLGLAPKTTTATTKEDTKLLTDLGVKIEEPKATPYVAPIENVPTVSLENIQKALLALGIDQTRSITELASPNYIEAKRIAGDIKTITTTTVCATSSHGGDPGAISSAVSLLWQLSGRKDYKPTTCYSASRAKTEILSEMTKKVNALGYKLLPNFDIEKM